MVYACIVLERSCSFLGFMAFLFLRPPVPEDASRGFAVVLVARSEFD